MDAIQVESTPQSKQKRRKHRPKVIVEGKPKRTRKPAEEKNVQLKENSTDKRKYVRRKGINKTPTTPAEQTIKDLTPESTKKSCKKTLFDGFAGTENATSDKDSEVGDSINVSIPCGIVTSMKEASKSSRGKGNQKIINLFEDNKNKRNQTTGNEESPNTSGSNIIEVHHNDLPLYRMKIETMSTSATTNLNEVEMTFSPQDARRLDYASNLESSEYDFDYDNFISRVRSCH
ncbi:hypothetical protein Ahy_B03g068078 [Arachis hypogaea]|uniref:Uncharacterized protein n=1 Tax=Arachis hypogaea TaxID=3818 RepID=A0A445A8K6_ARAHY|nr:hypothetical protein Ahy_B03g068078 [Arachis hypogaea]